MYNKSICQIILSICQKLIRRDYSTKINSENFWEYLLTGKYNSLMIIHLLPDPDFLQKDLPHL